LQLTSAATAVVTKLSSSVHNELSLRQFVSVGMLLQFESLISCHGDEMGMLEDMDVAMQDLSGVRFTVTSWSDGQSTTTTSMSGSRFVAFLLLKPLPLCTITCISRHPQLKAGEFCTARMRMLTVTTAFILGRRC